MQYIIHSVASSSVYMYYIKINWIWNDYLLLNEWRVKDSTVSLYSLFGPSKIRPLLFQLPISSFSIHVPYFSQTELCAFPWLSLYVLVSACFCSDSWPSKPVMSLSLFKSYPSFNVQFQNTCLPETFTESPQTEVISSPWPPWNTLLFMALALLVHKSFLCFSHSS